MQHKRLQGLCTKTVNDAVNNTVKLKERISRVMQRSFTVADLVYNSVKLCSFFVKALSHHHRVARPSVSIAVSTS